MISILTSYTISPNLMYIKFVGLSSDEKPTGKYKGSDIGNGSSFYEMNSGIKFLYDADGAKWWPQAASGDEGGSDAPDGSNAVLAEVIRIVALATGNDPITRIVVNDEAETELEIEGWNMEYVVPGDSLETLTITLPAEAPTSIAACIKVTILGITRHADPEDESEDPLLLPPTIILPEGLYLIGGYPEFDGDRWCLTIDNSLTATAMVIPAPPVVEGDTEGTTEGSTEGDAEGTTEGDTEGSTEGET